LRPGEEVPLETLVELANASLSAGQPGVADQVAELVLETHPDAVPMLHVRALAAFQQQRYDDAEQHARKALRYAPGVAAYHNTLGRACKAQGRSEDAVACYRRALEIDADAVDVRVSLGIALRTLGRLREAAQCYREALARKPDSMEAHANLANVLAALGERAAAQAAREHGDALRSKEARAFCEQAQVCRQSKQHAEAIALLRRAVERAPWLVDAHQALGGALLDTDRVAEAITHYRLALDLNPASIDAHQNIGNALARIGETAEAAECYAKVAQFGPAGGVLINNSLLLPVVPVSVEDIRYWRARLEASLDELFAADLRIDDPVAENSACLFYPSYHGADNRELLQTLAQLYLQVCPSLAWEAPQVAAWRGPGPRIRVGMISKFLRDHSIGRTTRGLVATLDRERFEVIALSVGAEENDEIGTFIRERADRYVVVPVDLAAARATLAELRLDVLFYQDIGMEPFTYFLAFSRLAPVQCLSFGHPETTGIPNMDYFISNDLFEPPEAAAHYSERLFLLNDLGTLAYYYPPSTPARTRDDYALPTHAHLYVCGQNHFKFHPEFDAILAEILRRDPRGRLVVTHDKIENRSRLLRARWERVMGDAVDRVIFLPRQSASEFTALFSVCDVALDTIHFNGMNTSLEAFAMGTPIVTWPRDFQRGRHTAGMYRKMGITDCIASSADEYVEIALALGTDPSFNRDVKAKIAARRSVLFEDIQVTREFERFFEVAVRESRNGLS
jgi:predicted O-linked N-acetylglucosamine transferase (SPINDLY family)